MGKENAELKIDQEDVGEIYLIALEKLGVFSHEVDRIDKSLKTLTIDNLSTQTQRSAFDTLYGSLSKLYPLIEKYKEK